MKRRLVRRFFLLVAMAVFAAGAFLRSPLAGDIACHYARLELPRLLGLEVGIGQCRIDPFRMGLELMGLSFAERGAETPIFAVDRVELTFKSMQTLATGVRIDRLVLVRPRLRVELPRGKPTASRDCSTALQGRVDARLVEIHGGLLDVVWEGGQAQLNGLDLALHQSRGRYHLRASTSGQERGGVTIRGVELPLARLEADLGFERSKLLIDRAEVALGEVSAFARGEVLDLCHPSLELVVGGSSPLPTLARLAPSPLEGVRGRASFEGTLHGPLDRLDIKGQLSLAGAAIEGFEVGDAVVELALKKDRLLLPRVEIPLGKGMVRAKAELRLEGRLPLTVEVEGRDVELGLLLARLKLPHAFTTFRSNVNGRLRGHLLGGFSLLGEAQAEVMDFRLFPRGYDLAGKDDLILAFERAKVSTAIAVDAEGVTLAHAKVDSERSHGEADARLGFDPVNGGFDVRARFSTLDLADLGKIYGIPWSGKATGEAHVSVVDFNPVIAGHAVVRDFKFAGIKAGDVEGDVHFEDMVLSGTGLSAIKKETRYGGHGQLDFGGEQLLGRGELRVQDGRIDDLLDVLAEVHWGFDLLHGPFDGRISGSVSSVGPVSAPTADIDLRLSDTTLFGRPTGSGPVGVHIEKGERAEVKTARLEGVGGTAELWGSMIIGGRNDFRLRARNMDLRILGGPGGGSARLRGLWDGDGTLVGDAERPKMSATARGRDIEGFGILFGDSQLAIELDGRRMVLKGPLGANAALDMGILLRDAAPYTAALSFDTEDLGRYLPGGLAGRGLSGALAGSLTVSGKLSDLEHYQAEAALRKLRLRRGGVSVQNRDPVRLSYGPSSLSVEELSLAGDGQKLSLSGGWGDDGALDATLEGTFDLKLLEGIAPSVERLAGEVELAASFGGTRAAPVLLGTAELKGARFNVVGRQLSARDLSGRVEFSQNRMIPELRGTLNGGLASLGGAVQMSGFWPSRFDLDLGVVEARIPLTEQTSATMSGQLALTGRPERMTLGGDIDVVRLRYTEEISVDRMVLDLRKARAEEKEPDEKEWLRYDLGVSLPEGGGVRLDNNLARLAVSGKLNLVGTNLHPGLVGLLRLEPGGRAYYRGNEYEVSHGTVEFKERDRVAANFDVLADAQVREYRVRLHGFGSPEDPKVQLSSEPSLPEGDLLTLLAFGFTSRDRAGAAANSAAGLVTDAAFNASGLHQQVKKFFPKNRLLLQPQIHVGTSYSPATGQVEPTAELESRLLTDKLRFRLTQPLIGNRGRRAQAEYRFGNGISFQAQWDNDSNDYSFGDLGLDLKWRTEGN